MEGGYRCFCVNCAVDAVAGFAHPPRAGEVTFKTLVDALGLAVWIYAQHDPDDPVFIRIFRCRVQQPQINIAMRAIIVRDVVRPRDLVGDIDLRFGPEHNNSG